MRSTSSPWLIIAAGTAVLVLVAGMQGAFGLFLMPISQTYGWGRTPFALASAVGVLLPGLLSPFAGAVSDRFGTGRVIVAGGAAYGLGLVVMAFGDTPLLLMLGRGLLIGAAAGMVGFAVTVSAVSRLVPEAMHSRAAGITASGAAMGQAVFLPVAHGLIALLGWQLALVAMAGLLVLLVPSALVLGRASPPALQDRKLTVRTAVGEAARHHGFWMLTFGFFVCGVHYGFIVVHLPAALLDRGLSTTMGAAALFLVNLANIGGTILWGHWGTARSKKYLLSTLYLMRTGVLALFFLLPLTPSVVVALSLGLGLVWFGTVPLTSGIVRQIFGMQYLSMLFGIVFCGHQVGAFLGSWLGGAVYDASQSYAFMWAISLALGLLSALIHVPIDDRPLERLAPAPAAAG